MQCRTDGKVSSSAPDDSQSLLEAAADVFLSEFTVDLVLLSRDAPFSTGTCDDFFGVPRLVGDKICRLGLSSELRMPVRVVTGDAGNFGCDGFL